MDVYRIKQQTITLRDETERRKGIDLCAKKMRVWGEETVVITSLVSNKV